ncbi:hypothetical protein [Streptomyces sp. NPDC102437]|uniref:hypothetical protein n=1 Tax=Streptomyces sp. NPDC102437 TaxID=3366175 RepID=UPI0038064834
MAVAAPRRGGREPFEDRCHSLRAPPAVDGQDGEWARGRETQQSQCARPLGQRRGGADDGLQQRRVERYGLAAATAQHGVAGQRQPLQEQLVEGLRSTLACQPGVLPAAQLPYGRARGRLARPGTAVRPGRQAVATGPGQSYRTLGDPGRHPQYPGEAEPLLDEGVEEAEELHGALRPGVEPGKSQHETPHVPTPISPVAECCDLGTSVVHCGGVGKRCGLGG